MKFELIANSMQNDGFKLKVQADSPEEMAVVKDLTEKLIEKISVIEIKTSDGDQY